MNATTQHPSSQTDLDATWAPPPSLDEVIADYEEFCEDCKSAPDHDEFMPFEDYCEVMGYLHILAIIAQKA